MEQSKLIKQINELSQKSKTIGLTEEEKVLQQKLRKEYLKIFRHNFEKQIVNIRVIDKNNNDVTPKKIIKKKEKINNED